MRYPVSLGRYERGREGRGSMGKGLIWKFDIETGEKLR